jgi:hypothetical protein
MVEGRVWRSQRNRTARFRPEGVGVLGLRNNGPPYKYLFGASRGVRTARLPKTTTPIQIGKRAPRGRSRRRCRQRGSGDGQNQARFRIDVGEQVFRSHVGLFRGCPV